MPEKSSPVEFVRQEVCDKLVLWERIRAALDGEDAVRALKTKILPAPNPADTSIANVRRYDDYIQRAVWYNVAARTLSGLAGYVFAKEPTINLPEAIVPLETDVDGSGVTIAQQAKTTLRNVLAYGRSGLLVDYPKVEQATTKQDLMDGKVSPAIILYEPEQITNWKTSKQGSQILLDMLVLKETHIVPGENEFEFTIQTQYRVLTRDTNGVQGRLFRKKKNSDSFEHDSSEDYQVMGSDGKALPEIPFVFVGSMNNDSTVDLSPLADLVNLNIAHFRNSADHEEACFIVGQPTPWVSGLTEAWVKDVLKGVIQLGSRAIMALPMGASAGLLQAEPNTMPFEAMKHKELQMVALGAKLVEQQTVQRTATEAGMDHSSQVSILVAAATNVFLAYMAALKFCVQFVGAGDAKIEFELSEPLTKDIVTPEQATSLMGLWMGGLIDFEEARGVLKKAGVAWKDDALIKQVVTDEGLNTPPPTVPPGGKPKTPPVKKPGI
jgi:hypothetical protein